MSDDTSNQYVIEKGLPIPDKFKRKPYTVKFPYKQMEVGDSFLVPDNGESTSSMIESNLIGSAMRWVMRNNLDWIFETRIVREGVRIWRIR